jgi:site-specific recombinase XerD
MPSASDRSKTIVAKRGPAGYRLDAAQGKSIAAANEFLEQLSIRGLSPATLRAYAFDLVVLYRWLRESDLVLEALAPADLLRFIDYQQRAGAQPNQSTAVW